MSDGHRVNPDPGAPAPTKGRPGAHGPNAGSFKPGVSGNPTGFSKTTAEVRARLRELGLPVINELAAIAFSPDTPLAEKVKVCRILLDYSVCKPRDEGAAVADAQNVISALAAVLTRTAPLPQGETDAHDNG